ncbi:hypothetical protein ESCO_001837 [Escovopsis weberi]|uniref:Uncharacterized protein n=1 Tax=Escovopsis weberi TaxID=150374 RepID=A0A0M8MZC7_ESCWE|nr:hypothetical protein ESCO_001837 [Escovopsis weberi]
MATTDEFPEPHVQRRRHFATWVKKLTNFKSSSDGERQKDQGKKTRRASKLNNPYPQSGSVSQGYYNGDSSYSFTAAQHDGGSLLSCDSSEQGRWSSEDHPPRTAERNSVNWNENQATRPSIAQSHGASSLAGTAPTIGGQGSRRGGDSTFSSPAPSIRSLATTLTTIQSTFAHPQGNIAPSIHSNTQSIQFSQPFPNMASVSAIPAHLAPPNHPTTYNAATANNLLTDDASILTLASSSKRRRRRSMDTDASVRALAPSSVWGGSRESLPLSVLSANIDPSNTHSSSRLNAERNSIYSATGVAPAIPGERSSAFPRQGDGSSVRSGRLGHGRPDSISGSAALASPREVSDEGSGDEDDESPPK